MDTKINYESLFLEAQKNPILGLNDICLPIDDNGVDILRSRQVNWKKENNFNFYFFKVIEILLYKKEQSANKIANDFNFEFSGLYFPESIELAGLDIPSAFDLDNCVFEGDFKVTNCRFRRGLTLSNSIFKKIVSFRDCKIWNLISTQANFQNTLRVYECDFENEITFYKSIFYRNIVCEKVAFHGTVDFSKCKINQSLNKVFCDFFDIVFYDGSFESTEFNCGLALNNIVIKANVEFINTLFSNTQDVDFNKIVIEGGKLVFLSTDDSKKIFNYTTRFAIKEQHIDGQIVFENVDFNRLDPFDKENFIRLSKSNREKVIIGKGCLKYRHTTQNITIRSNDLTQRLMEDMANTFVNFFTKHNRYNLGFQVVEKKENLITYFYFSDEDISDEEFLSYLRYTENDMWDRIKNESLNARNFTQINAMADNANALQSHFLRADFASLFYKMGVAYSTGEMTDTQINQILSTVHFNEHWESINPSDVIKLLEARFTPQILIQQFNFPHKMKQIINTLNNFGKMINADAVTIIESSPNLSENDKGIVQFIQDNAKTNEEKVDLLSALEVIRDNEKGDDEKLRAKDLWKKFLESGVGELATEVIKGLISPTFWAFVMS